MVRLQVMEKGSMEPMPGQDLLVQSLSGLAWLNGNQNQPRLPWDFPVADLFAGQHLAQGILAALIKRASCGEGSYVHVSMLESVMDMQFEVFTTYLNDGGSRLSVLQSITQWLYQCALRHIPDP